MAGHIALGVSASIALHRALDLTSELRKQGHEVSVLMTQNATKLIAPVTFQALSHRKVFHDMWELVEDFDHDHIRVAQDCSVFVLAPATAGTVGKLAHGICDNIVTTAAMAFSGPKILAPAMNWRMWSNALLQENIAKLENQGWKIIAPTEGDLACGEEGPGRLADVSEILVEIQAVVDR